MQQAFPVFEGAEGGRVHAPVEYIQIKELAESVRNYGVSANFTIAQVERLAASGMTPADWTTVVKAVFPNMGMYLCKEPPLQLPLQEVVLITRELYHHQALIGDPPFQGQIQNYGTIQLCKVRAVLNFLQHKRPFCLFYCLLGETEKRSS